MSKSSIITFHSDFCVTDLDRSALGSFAHSDEVLAALHVLTMADFEKDFVFAEYTIKDETFFRLFGAELKTPRSGYPKSYNTIVAEYEFWCHRVSGGGVRNCIGGRYMSEDALMQEVDRLTQVVDNPRHHSFYRVGMWDDALIARYVAEGIDADMAVTLS